MPSLVFVGGNMGIREQRRHKFAFEAWYQFDRDFDKTLDYLRQNQYIIGRATLYRWAEKYGWHERANVLDAEVERKRMLETIEEQAAFFRRKASAGKLLQKKAVEYLQNAEFDSSFVALNALRLGFQLEQGGLGLPDWLFEVVNADEEELKRIYERTIASIALSRENDEEAGDVEDDILHLPPLKLGGVS